MNAVSRIETGIPCPPTDRGRGNARFPFRQMEIGQSLLIEGRHAKAAGQAAYRAGLLYGMKFTTRKLQVHGAPALRIWRLE